MQTSAIKDTQERLEKFRGRFAEIARKHRISYSWLTKFAQGNVENPTLRNLDALRKALDKLEAADAATRTSRGAQGHG